MATFSKVNSFVEALAEKVHNLWSDQLVVALTNTAHTSTWTKLTDLTQIDYTNLSTRNITTSSSAQTLWTYKLVLADLSLTASWTVWPFRYIYIYNDTATNDELIWYYDYWSAVTLANRDIFIVGFWGTDWVFTVT